MGIAPNVSFEQWPKQGPWLGKRTRVCFYEEPWRTIISLDDGRVVLATECMHSPETE